MQTHVLVGVVLILTGLGELPIALLISSRVPPEKRVALLAALGMSGLAMVGLGIAFAAGLIPLG